jgi:DNA-binding protein H-NS
MARKRTIRTIQDIDAEIAQLQRERDRVRDADKADVIARMKEAIGYYAITAADLGLKAKPGRPGAVAARAAGKRAGGAKTTGVAKSIKAPKKKRAVGRVKFRDDAGHTWSGFGPRPKWLVEALASGKTEDELRVS